MAKPAYARGQVQITRNLSASSNFAKKARKAGEDRLTVLLDRVGELAVAETEKIIAAELVTNRPPARRKGGAKLAGSIRFDVRRIGGSAPFQIVLFSQRNNQQKVWSLEWGAKPHTIRARNKPNLWLPRLPAGSGRFAQAYTTKKRNAGPVVQHPGNRAFAFMRRGLEKAVQQTLKSGGQNVARKARRG